VTAPKPRARRKYLLIAGIEPLLLPVYFAFQYGPLQRDTLAQNENAIVNDLGQWPTGRKRNQQRNITHE
jgi:hypothetical protein